LPDGLAKDLKYQFWYILEGQGLKNVSIFHANLVYFMAIWNNLWPFGIVSGHLVYFSSYGMFGPRKIWQPGHKLRIREPVLPM
jgi:hypothetical protein